MRWAGVHYRYYPVRLPRHAAAFHPKLYITSAPDGLSLLVASANLTPSSLYENAEIADLLTLDRDGQGDRQAFSDLLTLLEALLALPADYLSTDARDSVRVFCGEISELVLMGSSTEASKAARILHSARSGLLQQVATAIPRDEVQEIVAISPFFDRECRAIRDLASVYPDASLRVITRLEPTDLHYDFLGPLSDRLKVYGFDSPLRLHAKAFLFRTPNRSWLLAGSANLTAPAWLSGIEAGGNLEAVVLREGQDLHSFDGLVDGLDLTELPLPSLKGRPDGEEEPDDGGTEESLAFGDVLEEDRGLRIIVHAGVQWQGARAEAWLEAPEVYLPLEVDATADGDDLVLRGRTPAAVIDREGAFLIHVRLYHSDGSVRSGAAWLHRLEMIRLPARERRLRRAVALLEESGWSDSADDYGALVDLWRMSIEDLGDYADMPSEANGRQENEKRESHPDGRITLVHRTVGERQASQRRLLHRASESLYRILTEPPALGQTEDLDDSGDEEHGLKRFRAASEREIPRRERKAALANDESLVHAVSELFRPTPSPEMAGEILLRMDVLLQMLLQRYTRQVEDPISHPEFMRFHFRRVLSHAYSLKGAEYGRPEGWMLRAWSEPSLRIVLAEEMQSPPRRSVLLACLVLGAEDPGTAEEDLDTSSLRGLMAGLELTAGEPLWSEARTRDEFAHLMDSLNQQAESLPPGEAALHQLRRLAAEPIPLMEAVRRFEPVLRFERGDPLPTDTADLPRLIQTYVRLRRAKEAKGQKPLALAQSGAGSTRTCNGCWVALPAAMEEKVMRDEDGAQCPHCGRLLLPFDHRQEGVVEVLHALDGGPTTPENAA